MTETGIIDTHLHLVNRSRLTYPWLANAGSLNADWSLESYGAEARRVGIIKALHMEVDVAENDIGNENTWVAELSQQEQSLICGIISACRPEGDGFAAQVERAKDDILIKGFRRVLHVIPDEVSKSTKFINNIRRLSGTGLTFDLCLRADQLKLGMALVDAAPDVSFVLDHCGVPDIAGEQFLPWRNDMADFARRDNVTAKVSGIIAYTRTEQWVLNDLAPYVQHVVDSFGFDRLVWGGDWPVCTLGGGLSTWVAASQALLAGATHEERAKLFSGNASRIWKL
ncbi:amidohydrolase family protein [Qingshengfaniella alkalisoli]|uniref:Amidohydrolase family protein n=1 Tax=Qingshengfaniella alkalisoli TaxID=2599296 RepID=A0A5B8IZE7_9RHOB|nr:amidohydrolase [Qingshengfaniella alkalisoli]QDY71502.1 amidohydrolase family protein [Qingshengfaniella alkalisoli]